MLGKKAILHRIDWLVCEEYLIMIFIKYFCVNRWKKKKKKLNKKNVFLFSKKKKIN